MDPSSAEALLYTFSPQDAQTPPTPQSAPKHRGRCASLGALGKTKPRQKTAGQASTTYLHQPPCRPFTQSPNLKPELTPFQELPFNTTDALYTPILASRPEDILSARAYTHLIRAPPIETDVHSPRDTYPAGCCSPWPGPVATRSRVRSAVLLAHSHYFHRLLHWGSPGEPDPPLKRSVTHGEGRGRH